MSSTFDVTVGALVWLDGSMWSVHEISNGSVLVAQEHRIRRVATSVLARAHAEMSPVDLSGAIDSVPLSLSPVTIEAQEAQAG